MNEIEKCWFIMIKHVPFASFALNWNVVES